MYRQSWIVGLKCSNSIPKGMTTRSGPNRVFQIPELVRLDKSLGNFFNISHATAYSFR